MGAADTLEELAARSAFPQRIWWTRCARFNELAQRGDDEDFGRGGESYDRAFTGGASPLVPIDTPPFHAAAFGVSDLGTKGGLRTDADARVLDAEDRPIPASMRRATRWPRCPVTTYRRRQPDRRVAVVQPPRGAAHGKGSR